MTAQLLEPHLLKKNRFLTERWSWNLCKSSVGEFLSELGSVSLAGRPASVLDPRRPGRHCCEASSGQAVSPATSLLPTSGQQSRVPGNSGSVLHHIVFTQRSRCPHSPSSSFFWITRLLSAVCTVLTSAAHTLKLHRHRGQRGPCARRSRRVVSCSTFQKKMVCMNSGSERHKTPTAAPFRAARARGQPQCPSADERAETQHVHQRRTIQP